MQLDRDREERVKDAVLEMAHPPATPNEQGQIDVAILVLQNRAAVRAQWRVVSVLCVLVVLLIAKVTF